MKIDVLIDYGDDQTFIDVLESVDEDGHRLYPYTYSKASEMIDTWLVVCEPEQVNDLEDALKQPPLKLIFVGSYDVSGSQYIWTIPGEKQRNHTLQKYKAALRDVIDYDENGEPIGSHPPSDAEAENTQVNKVFGWGDRVIEDIEIINN